MNPSCFRRRDRRRQAVALVIVLAFVVLLTGLVVAFFSNSLLYRQISNSSANEAKVDLFAQGAVDTIVGDLKQEIAAGSNATLYTDANGKVAGQTYRPFNANTAVPAQALKGSSSEQSGVTSYAANLVKRSAYTQNFFPAGSDPGSANYNNGNTSETISASATPSASPPSALPHAPSNRAANVASTVASQNGRLISLALEQGVAAAQGKPGLRHRFYPHQSGQRCGGFRVACPFAGYQRIRRARLGAGRSRRLQPHRRFQQRHGRVVHRARQRRGPLRLRRL